MDGQSASAPVKVAGIGKIKTIMQMVALIVLLYQKDLDGLRLFHGEVLLGIAAVLTIWSGLVYARAALPVLRASEACVTPIEAPRPPAPPLPEC